MYVARNHVHSKAPVIDKALEAAIAKVRSDNAREDWVLCGFQGGDDIRLIGTGIGGIEVSTARDLPELTNAPLQQADFNDRIFTSNKTTQVPIVRNLDRNVGDFRFRRTTFQPALPLVAARDKGKQSRRAEG